MLTLAPRDLLCMSVRNNRPLFQEFSFLFGFAFVLVVLCVASFGSLSGSLGLSTKLQLYSSVVVSTAMYVSKT